MAKNVSDTASGADVEDGKDVFDDQDVYVPSERLRSALSPPSLRRRSSLGSLHHAGHTSWLTASGHLITAIIGAGVLGLPNGVAWLGWIAGPACIVLFFAITLWNCRMLTDCYNVNGKRHTRYKWAVLHIMGPRHSVVLATCQLSYLVLTTIGYMIAAADSSKYIAKLVCKLQGAEAHCPMPAQWQHTLVFAGVQVLMSLLPNLESAWWSSIIGAAMSIGYSAIGIALGGSQATNMQGSLLGRSAPALQKTFGVLNSLGNIGFAFGTAIVLLEVQDTLREPPAAAVSMKKTVNTALSTTFVCYIAISVLGYIALGDTVPDNVLLGFTNSPAWVNIIANALVLVHMVSAWQVYAQPVFQAIEDGFVALRPTLNFVTPKQALLLRFAYRTVYVGIIAVVAILLPFFGAITGLIGAITYFPTSVFYPIMMYRRVMPVSRTRNIFMWIVLISMGLVAVAATAGAIETLIHSATSFKLLSSD